MAYLAKISSGNFSNSVYNIIDNTSAALWTTNQLNNIVSYNNVAGDAVSGAGNSNARSTIAVATSSTYISATFAFGTSSITHFALKVSRWLTTTSNPTISMCLLDSGSNVVSNSSFTLSTIGNLVNYPVDIASQQLYSNSFAWQVYKFPATVSVSLTQSYSLRLSSTTTNFAYLCTATNYRAPTSTFSAAFQASASNIQKFFITAATQTATSNDTLYIQGEFTGNGNSINSVTISMNETSSSNIYDNIELGYRGSLVFGTASNTNYYLKLNGDLVVNTGGYVSIGSSNFPIPSTSTASIEFSSNKRAGAGIILRGYGTMEAYGKTMSFVKTILSRNASTSSVITADNTSWNVGNSIVLAPTEYTATEVDVATISSISSNNIILTSTLSYTHSGTGSYIGEVANLTRNVRIFGNNTYPSFIDMQGGICNFNYVEFSELGSHYTLPTATTGTTASNWNFRIASGINYATSENETKITDPSVYKTNTELIQILGNTYSGIIITRYRNIQNSVIKNSQGFMSNLVTWNAFSGASQDSISNGVSGNQVSDILLHNNIIYNIRHTLVSSSSATPGGIFYFQQPSSTNNSPLYYVTRSYNQPYVNSGTVSNNLFIGNIINLGSTNNNYISDSASFLPSDFAFINNTITGSYNAIGGASYFGINAGQSLFFGDFSGNIFHSNGSTFSDSTTSNIRDGAWLHFRGYDFFGKTINNCIFWKNNLGVNISRTADTTFENCVFDNNLNGDIVLKENCTNVKFISCTFSKNTSNAIYTSFVDSVSGIQVYTISKNSSLLFERCTFASHSQIFTIATASITSSFNSSVARYSTLNMTTIFNNCSISSPLIISTFSSFVLGEYSSIKLNNVNGTYSSYYNAGFTRQDTQYVLSGSFSTRATPTNGYTFNLYKVKPLKFEFKVIPAPINRRAIISVYVRKSVIADGIAYGGSEVSLIVSENSSIGINSDTVLATTTSASNGSWEKITGITTTSIDNGVFEVYLTCNGNTGFINADSWEVSYIQ